METKSVADPPPAKKRCTDEVRTLKGFVQYSIAVTYITPAYYTDNGN